MPVNLGCQITFRPESPVIPSLELLETMCVMKVRRANRPLAANENLQKTA